MSRQIYPDTTPTDCRVRYRSQDWNDEWQDAEEFDDDELDYADDYRQQLYY